MEADGVYKPTLITAVIHLMFEEATFFAHIEFLQVGLVAVLNLSLSHTQPYFPIEWNPWICSIVLWELYTRNELECLKKLVRLPLWNVLYPIGDGNGKLWLTLISKFCLWLLAIRI